jgi:UDP-N-acetylglucosamine 2-epimerase (non-hydrolysing)
MAPVIRSLRLDRELDVRVLCSGQHKELLDPLFEWFELRPDDDLDVMTSNQGLSELSSRLLRAFGEYLSRDRFDLVVAQGDTTTVLCAAMACYFGRIPFAHVEAGLRTRDLQNPFPEEFNRLAVGHVSRLHFCPTQGAALNLEMEFVNSACIHVTGNTVIDALRYTTQRLDLLPRSHVADDAEILVTAHRRENFGVPLQQICVGLLAVCDAHPDVRVVYPVHPNPNVKSVVTSMLNGHDRIRLVEPMPYPELVDVMRRARLILTDSGGIQEEAPALGRPVLVLRETTERPEAVDAGVAKLIGTDPSSILAEVSQLLTNPRHYSSMARGASPYGDGLAARRIHQVVRTELGLPVTEEVEDFA